MRLIRLALLGGDLLGRQAGGEQAEDLLGFMRKVTAVRVEGDAQRSFSAAFELLWASQLPWLVRRLSKARGVIFTLHRVLPDEIWVCDAEAFALAAATFPGHELRLQPNTHQREQARRDFVRTAF